MLTIKYITNNQCAIANIQYVTCLWLSPDCFLNSSRTLYVVQENTIDDAQTSLSLRLEQLYEQ